MPVMDKTNHSFFIDRQLGGHASKLEQIDFLSTLFQYAVRWVRYADKWQSVLFPVICEGLLVFRPENQNLRVLSHKLIVVKAQLRHVPLAERSEEAAIKNQQHILSTLKV